MDSGRMVPNKATLLHFDEPVSTSKPMKKRPEEESLEVLQASVLIYLNIIITNIIAT